MSKIDLVGVPIPVDLPEFKNDTKLLRGIAKVESLIEITYDMEDADDALTALKNSIKNENQSKIISIFNCMPYKIAESLLSYIVVLYARAFNRSIGRTKLDNKTNEIFKENIDKHEYIINLRNKFYAHQMVEANKHQMFYRPNTPVSGKVSLNRTGQTKRVFMPMSIDIETVHFCISKVKEYLEKTIDKLCAHIENSFTKKQLEILLKASKEESINKYWKEVNNKNLFSERKT